MRAIGRIFTAVSIAILGLVGFGSPAAADCASGPAPFAESVANAKRIVIGDVVAVVPIKDLRGGLSGQFTIQVSDVVRGDAVARLDMSYEMADPCSGNTIVARIGDRIALAFEATAFSRPLEVTGVAWIVGQQPGGFEMTTVEDVYRLAGVPMPEPRAVDVAPDPTSPWLGPALWGLGVGLVFVIGAVLARRAFSTG
jgi:hypothetical protein